MNAHLLYVADPMCSWCWGFAPELDALAAGTRLEVRILLGGLRPGKEAQPLDRRLAGFLRGEWTRIAQVTGQPFDMSALDREGWLYDTELPSRAVVAARRQSHGAALALFRTIQRAFYAEAVDVTTPAAYPELVVGLDLDSVRFEADFTDPETAAATWNDFRTARSLGVTGFPSLLLSRGEQLSLLARGYQQADVLEEAVYAALGPT